jgi:hypothetical protein
LEREIELERDRVGEIGPVVEIVGVGDIVRVGE